MVWRQAIRSGLLRITPDYGISGAEEAPIEVASIARNHRALLGDNKIEDVSVQDCMSRICDSGVSLAAARSAPCLCVPMMQCATHSFFSIVYTKASVSSQRQDFELSVGLEQDTQMLIGCRHLSC